MNKRYIVLLLGCVVACGGEPFKPHPGTLPFLVYFPSRYRGVCVGTLVSRVAVLTAAVCVVNPVTPRHDSRAINVVVGTTYRHPRRGIRVQVTRLLIPRLLNDTGTRGYMMQKSVVVMLLKYRVADALVEVPLRALPVAWRGEEVITLQEQCFMAGWHFFYKGDRIFPAHKFLLQRTVRAQFVSVVKTDLWCDTLSVKFQKALYSLGYHGHFRPDDSLCIKDPERMAQPCHGMYGSPLVCRGQVTGVLTAPDAQWTNCTGFTNLVHLVSGDYIRRFMECIDSVLSPDDMPSWPNMKKALVDADKEQYDYLPAIYDKIKHDSAESDF